MSLVLWAFTIIAAVICLLAVGCLTINWQEYEEYLQALEE